MQSVVLEGFRLSPQQAHLWSLQQDGSVYSAQIALLIEGKLDQALLKGCLRRSVQRHEILRTTFRSLPGMKTPVQVIDDEAAFAWEERDLIDTEPKKRCEIVEGFISEERKRPFNFEQGPLLRSLLLKLPASKYALLITLPAMCADSRSLTNLAQEISYSYAAGGNDASNEETVQYIQFSEWQTELLVANEGAPGRVYWRQQLATGRFDPDFPLESHPVSPSDFAPQSVSMQLSAATVGQIETLSRHHQASIPDFMLACVFVLLNRMTRQEDLWIGYGCEGRNFAELEHALGLFARYVPLRCSLAETLSLTEVLQRVCMATREALEWQESFSWEQVENLQESRDGHAFLPFCFDYSQRSALASNEDTAFSIYRQFVCGDRFKYRFSCIQHDDGITAELHYDPQRLAADHASGFIGYLKTLIESALRNPEASIGASEILTGAERQRLLVEFNDTAVHYPKEKLIHQLIEEQAAQAPDQIAVVFADQQLTYAELNAKANKLAQHLRRLGVGPNATVALCVERSLEMVVGILGILKAGGAYVPLNPELPYERLAFMLKDAGARILLTRTLLLEKVGRLEARVVCLDSDWQANAQESQAASVSHAGPGNLAYVIYTSGSTGQPKGVLVTHQNLVHSTCARFIYYRVPASRFMLVSPFAFDSSVAGLFWTLCQGGTLILAAENFQQDLTQFVEAISRQRVSHLLCIPSLWEVVLSHAHTSKLDSLRAVIVAGEACSRKLILRHDELLPHVSLFNEYGPTEATVWCSVYEYKAEELPAQSPPIGRPISNTQIYVLDSHLHPVPAGVPGELHVGGDGVACGYLNQPELTATKFISDPFSNKFGARLYRTGDLARYLPDGNIEFLGRIDNQVKIRGFRVELEEIENVLKQHPLIRDAVVTASRESAGPRQQTSPRSANAQAGQTYTNSLAEQLLSVPAEQAERLLRELEDLAEEDVEMAMVHETQTGASGEDVVQRSRTFANFDISLRLKSAAFINPPRRAQREWVLNQALSEFADDLRQLDKLTKRFIPGAEMSHSTLAHDRSQAALSEQEIMEDWQIPLMRAMAQATTETNGDVLEIGFGRGVSATFIQTFGANSHTIIECNDYVERTFYREWQKLYQDRNISLIHGRWQDVMDGLGLFDGIMFHAYPLNPNELAEHVAQGVTFAENFFPVAAEHLRSGGTFTYLTHEIDSFSRRHQRLIFKYFSSFTLKVVPLVLPEESKDLWWADSMVVVNAVK